MGSYIPSSEAERNEMLKFIGMESYDELFSKIPSEVKVDSLKLPEGISEIELMSFMNKLSKKNKVYSSIFRGAGAYNHYIPSIVKSVVSKEEFVTAYTPYQAEISQGLLQSIFEFQTMICELTGMDVSNASVYDEATAAAEAVLMCRDKKRNKVYMSSLVNPEIIDTVNTYIKGLGMEIIKIPESDGKTDYNALNDLISDEAACVFISNPNFFGIIEDCAKIGEIAHRAGAKFIMGINPISCAILSSPKECGADIAVGNGQPLGIPLSFGGPHLGFMACTESLLRKLPGRIVGQTKDLDGKRAFVLTMQAREQHIRREKASSNICSNQALCALTASVYMSCMGASGLKKVASQCVSKAHYAARKISSIDGFSLVYKSEFFNEFITNCPIDVSKLLNELSDKDILGGLPYGNKIIWCVTEANTKEQIDRLYSVIKEAVEKWS